MSGRIRERCHPSHRFFTPCHISVFLLSHTAFLPLFRMMIEGESVIMQEMLIVILNECEGSIPVVRKAVRFSFRVCRIPLPKHMIKRFA